MTIVAAWIRAETGVGPAIASGSQTKSGICADLPTAPRKRKRQIAVATTLPTESSAATAPTPTKESASKFANMRNIATRNPKSPMRFTMKAFFPASAFALSLNQNPISR